jgi:hypothetical protein
MPRSLKPRHIPCPECPKLFTNKGGLSTHQRTHRRERPLALRQEKLNIARQQAATRDSEDVNHNSDSFNGWRSDDNDIHAPPSPGASPEPVSGVQGGEDVRIHPTIDGT